jgi:beta-glucosidase-like glycosyl hydrolase
LVSFFGETICARAVALMKGTSIRATGKHFPEHEILKRIHKALPTVHFLRKIRSNGVLPLKQMFKEGLSSVMVAHLNVPSLESRP